jgi:hypothetical protein
MCIHTRSYRCKRPGRLNSLRIVFEGAGYEVTMGVGKTGVVGLLRNGAGPTVMLRADMDALPVEEATGLPYASRATATLQTGNARRGDRVWLPA